MTIKTIYIARHGYRSNWLPKGPYPLPPTGVNSDVPLAEHGVNQARELAHYILSIENQPEMLFSSPFYRCLQTSEPISKLLELPINVERGIGEWYKPDRDVIPEPAPFEVLENFFKGRLDPEWESTVIPSGKGETEQQIYERCQKFLPLFVDKVETLFPNIETILLVTHAATKIALGVNLLGLKSCREPIDDNGSIIRSGSCSLDKYELATAAGANVDSDGIPFSKRHWTLTMNGNTEFLSRGEEMHWDFQYGFEAGSDADMKARRALAEGKQAEGSRSPSVAAPDSSEFEHVFVSVDVPGERGKQKSEIDTSATMQFSGLETNEPLFRIGDKIYQGSWGKLVGTELALPNAAEIKKRVPQEDDDLENDSVASAAAEEEEDLGPERIYRIKDRVVLENLKPL
ncbi:LAMI_0B02388g1_1 [Lachancea mirantina]|uniref:LAMI_0B02388g1_1 n=1 Tax=Lachancea mirantina TaxID=1230905 RepID=A0A1G4IU30_9SACH|nr:LAMI_0B02388g1_1 [Lachancea mirantina]